MKYHLPQIDTARFIIAVASADHHRAAERYKTRPVYPEPGGISLKTLVVCYSRKGTTAKVADAIAEGLGAVAERIIDKKDRSGIFGWLSAGRDAGRERPADIEEPKNDPATFDLVVIGTPVWSARMSTPILAYLKRYASKFQKVAFFMTCAGRYKDTMEKMAIAAGKQPVATLVLLQEQVKKNEHLPKVRDFVGKLQG